MCWYPYEAAAQNCNTLLKVVHSEIVVVAMSFHLRLAWEMLILYFLCPKENGTTIEDNERVVEKFGVP